MNLKCDLIYLRFFFLATYLLFGLKCMLLKMQNSLTLKDFEIYVACIKMKKVIFQLNCILLIHLLISFEFWKVLQCQGGVWENTSPHPFMIITYYLGTNNFRSLN